MSNIIRYLNPAYERFRLIEECRKHLFNKQGKPLTGKERKKATERITAAKRKIVAERKKEAKEITSRITQIRIDDNKKKYGLVYKAFFDRDGVNWYQETTGMDLDLDRIYADIDYFHDAIAIAIKLEELDEDKTLDIKRLEKEIAFERQCRQFGYRYYNNNTPFTNRQIRMCNAVSKWRDESKINDFYMERDALISRTGVAHEVDHIIPITHDLVCGLHNEFNLRVITKAENQKKSNKFIVDDY